ncbi:hypothetical protein AURDEDRAFT_165625 [Auricularia subglabra TFB-10046 SS5]|nr:hypothetical protein AURDEDRAFT_165625 [Auricularia subglabra TFB-10046 SS5]
MSFNPLDPNRFATGIEAHSVRARVDIELADVELATRRHALAKETYRTAKKRFHETKEAFKLHKAAKEEALEYMEDARGRLDASIARLATAKAPVHPVRKTPLEVLGLIFELCLEHTDRSAIPESRAHVRARQLQPFYLAAVCRRWRQASHACPQAWSVFDLQLDDVSRSSAKYWEAFLTCFLDRSSKRPLDIRLIRKAPAHSSASRLVPLLVRFWFRWLCQSCQKAVFLARFAQPHRVQPQPPAPFDTGCAEFVPQTDTLLAHTAETRLASLCR